MASKNVQKNALRELRARDAAARADDSESEPEIEVIELTQSEAEEEPKIPDAPKKTKAVKTPDAPKKERKPRVPKEKAEKPAKRTRKPSVFNHFMKIRLAEMKEDDEIMEQYNHRERFTMAAHEWKALTDEEREEFKQTLAQEA
jgi:hypothetical protein